MSRTRSAASPLSIEHDRSRRFQRTAAIAVKYDKGTRVQDIADEFEVSSHTVLRIARAYGLKKRPRQRFGNEIKKGVLTDWKANMPLTAIAKTWGVSVAYVSYTAKAAGLTRYQPLTKPRRRKKK